MSKFLIIAIILLTASCNSIAKPHLRQTVQEDPNYPENTEYSEWTGPGWYWGVYINNENDYWNHHNNYHDHGDHGNHDHGDHGGGQRHDHGGGGHGGGGHR